MESYNRAKMGSLRSHEIKLIPSIDFDDSALKVNSEEELSEVIQSLEEFKKTETRPEKLKEIDASLTDYDELLAMFKIDPEKEATKKVKEAIARRRSEREKIHQEKMHKVIVTARVAIGALATAAALSVPIVDRVKLDNAIEGSGVLAVAETKVMDPNSLFQVENVINVEEVKQDNIVKFGDVDYLIFTLWANGDEYGLKQLLKSLGNYERVTDYLKDKGIDPIMFANWAKEQRQFLEEKSKENRGKNI